MSVTAPVNVLHVGFASDTFGLAKPAHQCGYSGGGPAATTVCMHTRVAVVVILGVHVGEICCDVRVVR